MRYLSFAVGLFAVVALVAGLKSPDPMVFLLAAAALGCAVTTFLSRAMSNFLKIFEAIFATETIVFGSAFLIDKLGWWPKAYAEYTLPDSLPFAVALFGVFVYLITFIPVVRKMLHVADPYFAETAPTQTRIWGLPSFTLRQNRLAIASLVFLIVINQIEVALDVRLSYFRADFTNALKDYNQPEFWRQLFLVFTPIVTALVAAYTSEYVVSSSFIVRWRRWLTASYTGRWMSSGTHYKMLLSGQPTDNPDQRISEDIYKFIDGAGGTGGIYNYSIVALSTLTSLVSYALVLWSLSGGFTLPGLAIVIPGLLFWVALIYSGAGTLLTHWIGHRLAGLNFAQQRYEANFRFGLARAREYSEQIGLLHGEAAETAASNGRFNDVFENYMSIVHVRKRLTAFVRTYSQASVLIPYIVAAPFYFLKSVSLGALNQIGAAFNSVNESLNFFVNYYVTLAEFKATLDRLNSFDQSIERAKTLGSQTPCIANAPSSSGNLVIDKLALNLPDGRPLARVESLTLAPFEPTLLTGPSGSGKSTLFRAIAGIWPFGSGTVSAPAGRLMLLPQRPYIPIGTLRAALAYPDAANAHSDAAMREALATAGLPALADRLDDNDNWQMRLSGGEQQRLAISRALLASPDWLFLDEATSALDDAAELMVYQAMAQHMPKTTLVSIGHRATLKAFHKRRLEIRLNEGGPATIGEALAATP